jgi:hypothetical protein
MAVWTRRLMLALLAVVVGLNVGCDSATLAYFFLPDAKEPARIKNLGSSDSKNVPRIAILTWGGFETRSEFIHADRQISDLLANELTELTKSNGEKLTIIPSRKIEDYKNNHPRWRAQEMSEIGEKLGADYVVYLEINSLSMYEPGSGNNLFRGRAELNVSLIDVHNPDDAQAPKPFSCIYPSDARGPEQVGFDSNAAQFREKFLTSVARNLSYYFSCYPKRNSYMPE